ncbi:MAG: hypothetical protein L0211_26150 [Planctomycetaceae bacterium]|nr:hypothetical protein [Planctomycetaceae bacterium]
MLNHALLGRKWLLAAGLVVLAAAQLRGDPLDAPFAAGLRERRLFELAERYCIDRLNSSQTSEVQRADLAVELVRTFAAHAGHVPQADRPTFWQAARSAAADFDRKWPAHPRRVLVRIQDALVPLAQGELAWHEHEAGLLPAERLEPARQALGQAAQMLAEIGKELARDIPLRRRMPPKPDELSAEELSSLELQVQYQAARARRLAGLLHPPGSDDRLAQLVAARQILEPLRAQVVDDDVLAALVRLELAECWRLTERYDEAAECLAGLDAEGIEPGIRLQARAAALRLAIGQRNSLEAKRLIEEGDTVGGQAAAELDLARLEALLTLGEFAQAESAMKQIAARHGEYWSIRAGQRLAALPRNAPLPSAELLARRGNALVLGGKLEEALADFDRAAEMARQTMDERAAFERAYKAALVAQKLKRSADAASRFRALATASPKHHEAPAAHLLAAWNAKNADEYAAILREHISLWPAAESAAQARLSLAAWAESRGQWQEALDNYAAIGGLSPHFAQANSRLAELAKEQPDSGPVQEAFAASLLEAREAKLFAAALAQWRSVTERSKPGAPRWVRAQYGAAQAHFKLGDKAAAADVLRGVINQPGALDAAWKEKYAELLRECERQQ